MLVLDPSFVLLSFYVCNSDCNYVNTHVALLAPFIATYTRTPTHTHIHDVYATIQKSELCSRAPLSRPVLYM